MKAIQTTKQFYCPFCGRLIKYTAINCGEADMTYTIKHAIPRCTRTAGLTQTVFVSAITRVLHLLPEAERRELMPAHLNESAFVNRAIACIMVGGFTGAALPKWLIVNGQGAGIMVGLTVLVLLTWWTDFRPKA